MQDARGENPSRGRKYTFIINLLRYPSNLASRQRLKPAFPGFHEWCQWYGNDYNVDISFAPARKRISKRPRRKRPRQNGDMRWKLWNNGVSNACMRITAGLRLRPDPSRPHSTRARIRPLRLLQHPGPFHISTSRNISTLPLDNM